MKVIHEPTNDSPFLVIVKEPHLPSAPLFEGDKSVLTLAAEKYPEILSVKGKKEVEYGLVHRIDTETSGLVLIATTQKSYDNLTSAQKMENLKNGIVRKLILFQIVQKDWEGFQKHLQILKKKSSLRAHSDLSDSRGGKLDP